MLNLKTPAMQDQLAAPLERIITEHGHKLRSMLTQQLPLAQALQQDETVSKVARFCYPLLPGMVRLVVKEAAFVEFVLSHRHGLLARLDSSACPTAVAG